MAINSRSVQQSGAKSAIKMVQLTDCHLLAGQDTIYKHVSPYRTLESVCRHIARTHPDLQLLLLTGDLSQDESADSYRHLADLLSQFSVPVYALPGNHDDSAQMRSAFGDRIRCTGEIELDGWQLWLLDSTVAGQTGGRLATAELQRLQDGLSQNTSPALIALHHPPLTIGSAWMDALGLENGDALTGLLQNHPQVRAVVFGHIHQEFRADLGPIAYLGAPSTWIQFKPGAEQYTEDTLPPAYRVLNLYKDGRFDSHVEFAIR
jgi:Icc protein